MIGVEKYVEIKTNGVDLIEGQPVPTRDPVVQTLNVTPLKTAQTFNAPSGVDGFNPVNVSAVTSSIDSNITAGNIKDGVTILGIQGNYTGAGATIEALSITPTTSEQTITASGIDGYSPITVSAVTSSIDANITAENIKSGVSILGVTGNYSGSEIVGVKFKVNGLHKLIVDNTVTKIINLDGAKDLDKYIFYYTYYGNTNIIGEVDLSSLTNVTGQYACSYCFSGCTGLTGVDLSGLTNLNNIQVFSYAFNNCTGITSIKIYNLKNITGHNACDHMFAGCTGITSVDLSSVELIQGDSSCQYMFSGCYNLHIFDLSALKTVSMRYGCRQMFSGCESLVSLVQLQSLETVGYYGCYEMFYGCTTITTMYFNVLKTITDQLCLSRCFAGCTSLSNLYFPALTSTSFGSSTNQFNNMLSGVTGCTVHFPSNLQSVIGSWTDVTNGFGGTNTTVLFDLTATT